MPTFEIEAGYEAAIRFRTNQGSDYEFPHVSLTTYAHGVDVTVFGDRAELLRSLHKAVLEAAEKYGVTLDEPVTAEVG